MSTDRYRQAAAWARREGTVEQRCAGSTGILAALNQHSQVLQLAKFEADMGLRQLYEAEYRDGAAEEFIGSLVVADGSEALSAGEIAVKVAAAYALQAIKAERASDQRAAWSLAFDAAQWEGYLSGLVAAGNPKEAAAELRAKILDGAARGGKKSAETRRAAAIDVAAVVAAARARGWPTKDRDIYGPLAKRFGCDKSRIGQILREAKEIGE